jgi:TPR repeat protein
VRGTLISILMALGLALSPMSVLSQDFDLEATTVLADRGDAEAQYQLGSYYGTDDATIASLDWDLSIKYLKMAAHQGHPEAQSHLGWMLSIASLNEIDEILALKYTQLAANQGHAYAQSRLALNYYNGQGTAKDLVLAYKWTLLARAQGLEDSWAMKHIERIEKEITPEQKAEGEALAKAFKPKTREDSRVVN